MKNDEGDIKKYGVKTTDFYQLQSDPHYQLIDTNKHSISSYSQLMCAAFGEVHNIEEVKCHLMLVMINPKVVPMFKKAHGHVYLSPMYPVAIFYYRNGLMTQELVGALADYPGWIVDQHIGKDTQKTHK